MFFFSSNHGRRVAVALAIAIVCVTIAATPVSAQNVTIETNKTETPDGVFRSIDGTVDMLSAQYDNGSLVVELEASEAIAVTVVGARADEGAMDARSVALKPGETQRIAVAAQVQSGKTGASIITDDVRYWYPHEVRSSWFGPPWTAQDAQVAAIGAGAGTATVAIAVVLIGIGRTEGDPTDGERLA